MRASFKIGNNKMALGPTDIQQTLPQSGEFKTSRGPAVIFPTQYEYNGAYKNVAETWTWNLMIEDEPIYTVITAQAYKGAQVLLTTEYGEDMGIPITYSGEILDITFEHKDGLTFKDNKRGYSCIMTLNTWR